MSVVQSMPTAWAPHSAISGSHWPPPLVNTITGTGRPADSRGRRATMRCMYLRENSLYAAALRLPPQVSKICTA